MTKIKGLITVTLTAIFLLGAIGLVQISNNSEITQIHARAVIYDGGGAGGGPVG